MGWRVSEGCKAVSKPRRCVGVYQEVALFNADARRVGNRRYRPLASRGSFRPSGHGVLAPCASGI